MKNWLTDGGPTPGATSRSSPVLTSPERRHELCLNVNI